MEKHIPVLTREVLEIFSSQKIRVFFDGTLGAGGHARSILEAHPEIEKYIIYIPIIIFAVWLIFK